MKNIIPHLWFDKEAKEATEFYASIFAGKITNITTLHDTPSGDADTVNFELLGQKFMAISAGPYFKPNYSISFMVNFDPSRDENAEAHLRAAWEKLCEGGKELMPLQEYAFSKLYSWIEDKYGFTWQLILTNPKGEERPHIIPSLIFTGEVCGKAEEAMNFYTEVFKDTKKGALVHYDKDSEFHKEGTVMFADFALEGDNWFAVMDSSQADPVVFNEALSLMVPCETQEEIDYYWEKLSAVPESEQCGWLKDKFGVSWQIVPTLMDEMMQNGTPEQIKRVTEAFLQMKKFDIAKLQEAYQGE